MSRVGIAGIGVLVVWQASLAADWAEFRGPSGTGLYTGPALVTEWGPSNNLTWKVAIPGDGWSSPVVVNNVVYLTSAIAQANEGQSLRAIAVDATTGQIRWNTEVFAVDAATAGRQHKKNTHASPTPVCDGERLYVHFGHMGTACLDLSGQVLWTRHYRYAPVHGTGGSPIRVDDLLVFSVDGMDQRFTVALDAKTGEQRWKTDRDTRPGKPFTFSTPSVFTINGQPQIVSPASDYVHAYDPKTGREIWRCKYPKGGYSLIARPIMVNGLLIIQTGYDTAHLFALDPNGTGDISHQIRWSTTQGAPHTPSPIAVGNELYTVTDKGMMVCYDAATGRIHWQERLKGVGYSASPIAANGLIYVTSEDGIGRVVKASTSYETIAESRLGERTFATFAPVNGSLFVRSDRHLYRFDTK